MATRSRIALKQDEKYLSVYCHNDGYPDSVGYYLNEFYNSEEKAKELIDLGWLSSLDERVRPEREYDKPRYDWKEKSDVKHSFDTPQKGVTIAYHRDRGEELQIDESPTELDLMKLSTEGWAAFTYLFKEDRWHVLDEGEWISLPDYEAKHSQAS